MTIFGWVILILLILTIFSLSLLLILIVKKATYLSKENRDLIIFIIDMYIEYGEEIGITSKDKHDIVVKKLKKIKDKLGV